MLAPPRGSHSAFGTSDRGTFTPRVRPSQPGQLSMGRLRTRGGASTRTMRLACSFMAEIIGLPPSRFCAKLLRFALRLHPQVGGGFPA